MIALSIIVWSCNNAGDNSTTTDSSGHVTIDSNAGNRTQDTGSSNTTNTTPMPVQADAASTAFLPKAADGGMAEVQQGQVAQQKGTNDAVKNFGSMMVRDHSAANDQLKALATRRNITLPDSLGSKNKKMLDDLNKKSTREFDKAYINAMVKDHQEDIKEFEEAEKKVTDTEVKSFITNTLPTLKMHLDSAKAIQKRQNTADQDHWYMDI